MKRADTPVYIGIGSNLDEPRSRVSKAFDSLGEMPQTRLVSHSSLYVSAPMGPQDQPDFVNAVALLETGLEPLDLLAHLQVLETASGRERHQRWGPRTLDLDILLYGDEIIDGETLTVPHPGLTLRSFVLCPLAEIAADLVIPGRGVLAEYLGACGENGLRRLQDV